MTTEQMVHEATPYTRTNPLALGEFVVPNLATVENSVDVMKDPEFLLEVSSYTTELAELTGRRQPYDEVLGREERFFTKVYNAGIEMGADHNNKVVLLFDVDQTLAEVNGAKRIIRPAFARAVSALHEALGDRLEVGLLTNVAYDEDAFTSFLAGIKPDLINWDYCLSTRDYVLPPPTAELGSDQDNDASYLDGIQDIIDRAITAAVRGYRTRSKHWHCPDGKLEIARQKVEETEAEGTAFVYIDNMPPAEAIRKDHPRLRGVCVAGQVHDNLWRAASVSAYRMVLQARAAGSVSTEG